jgi:hypothetical protein
MSAEPIAAAAGRPMTEEEVQAALGNCPHPAPARRLAEVDGGTVQVCTACGEEVAGEDSALVPRERPGGTDPTAREGSDRTEGGLRHVTWDPANPAASRPYTPEEVELEITDTLDRIERGAGWLTTREEERAAAKLEHELAYARALLVSAGKSEKLREAQALIATRDTYERWQVLELTCRTAREGMHNLRTKLSGLQSVLRSASAALSAGGGTGGWDR